MAAVAAPTEPARLLEYSQGEEEDPEMMSDRAAAPAAWRRRGVAAVAAVVAVAALALLASQRSGRAVLPGDVVVDGVTVLDAEKIGDEHEKKDKITISKDEDPCGEFPHLKLKGVKHSNLGHHGPDGGDEGLIYEGVAIMPAGGGGEESETPCDVKINAKTPYTPWPGMHNGMHGFYGNIVLKSGTSVKLDIKIVKPDSDEEIPIKHAALTFFDLDTDKGNKSVESVTISGMTEVTLSAHTEVITDVNEDGSKTFKASTFGTGADNPTNPLTLNQEQRNRAVTLDFSDVSSIPVELKASAGVGPRVFIFVGRPSLKCAAGVSWKKSAAAGQKSGFLLLTAVVGLALARSTLV